MNQKTFIIGILCLLVMQLRCQEIGDIRSFRVLKFPVSSVSLSDTVRSPQDAIANAPSILKLSFSLIDTGYAVQLHLQMGTSSGSNDLTDTVYGLQTVPVKEFNRIPLRQGTMDAVALPSTDFPIYARLKVIYSDGTEGEYQYLEI